MRKSIAMAALCALTVTACTQHGVRNTTGTTRYLFKVDETTTSSKGSDSTPSTSPGSTTSRPTTGDANGNLGKFHPAKPKWNKCDTNPDFECTTVAVPLDYADIEGVKIKIAVTRKVAADSKKRIGSLIINPGGPGGSGVEAAQGLVYEMPAEITDAFDFVGFDPRGVGESSPILCITNKDAYVAEWVDDTDPKSIEKSVSEGKRINQECAGSNATLLRHLSTYESAQDLDVLREALGDKKLTYLGFSYGTRLGGVYATLFPNNIRAMVLDGAVDPNSAADSGPSSAGDATTTTNAGATTTTTVDPNLQQFDKAFTDFAAACDKDTKCYAHSGAAAILETIRKSSLDKPLAVRGADFAGRFATRGIIETGVNQALYSQDLWPVLGLALADAAKGDGTLLLGLADQYSGRKPDGTYSNIIDAFRAINCADRPERPNDADVAAAIKKVSKSTIADLPPGTECLGFPIGPNPLPDIAASLKVPVLVVGTVGDPATPYENTAKLAKALTSGVVITWEGEGHTAFPKTPCITDIVAKYLVALTAPTNDPHCPSDTVVADPPSLDPNAVTTTNPAVTPDARSPFQIDRTTLTEQFISAFISQGAEEKLARCVAEKLLAAYDDETIIRLTGNLLPDGFQATAKTIVGNCRTP